MNNIQALSIILVSMFLVGAAVLVLLEIADRRKKK